MDRLLTTADQLLPDLAAQYRAQPVAIPIPRCVKVEALRQYLVAQGFARVPKDFH